MSADGRGGPGHSAERMHSLTELFQKGVGPSSSHTRGPQKAVARFLSRYPEAESLTVTLYGSLAATGAGHLTDVAIEGTAAPRPVRIVWKSETWLAGHPNAMDIEGSGPSGSVLAKARFYSIGGGAVREEGETVASRPGPYAITTMEGLLAWSEKQARPLWQYVEECEGEGLWSHLGACWDSMRQSIARGLEAEGVLPGALRLGRKSRSYYLKAKRCREPFQRTGLLAAYALAVAEENAAGHEVVTAPTCGASGVVPAVLRYLEETLGSPRTELLHALAVAGLIGNCVKHNASIAGAEVGCQGEIGTACAMAAGAAATLLGATPRQIEYAAEMGLEHHLGLTCDPVLGLVQIPCIERNAFAATRALDCADLALLSDGEHRISFDEVTQTMKQTGKDLQSAYRETAQGGLAVVFDG